MANRGRQYIKSAFNSPDDEFNGMGVRPVVFDILGPDHVSSILPPDVRMVLHVNPTTMSFDYTKHVERMQTEGGYVEQHWGEAPAKISFELATGGFVRVGSGVTAVTGPGPANHLIRPTTAQARSLGGTRRDTIAYDKYLDLLALYFHNGAVYDRNGRIAYHGIIKCSFDGGTWLGWFENFSVTEGASEPYLFRLSTSLIVKQERHMFRSARAFPSDFVFSPASRQSPTSSTSTLSNVNS